ncbi:phage tail tape measure protein [Bacteroidota bacterium]
MGIQDKDGALYYATGIDNSGLQRGKKEGIGILKGMAGQVSKLDLFVGLGVSATVAFKKIATEAYKMSKAYETAMKEVQTISKAVQDDYGGYTDALRSLSKDVPHSAEQLAKAYYQVVSAGYDGAAGLKLLEVASKAAVGGVTDVTTAADGMTTVLNAWKISADKSNEVADIFFQTVKLGKTNFGELAASISQVAPLAAASGVSFKEVSAAVASLTKQGTPTAQAMTQIRAAMLAMNEQLGKGWGETMTLQEGFQALLDISTKTGKQLNEVTGRAEGALAVYATTGENAKGAAEDLREMNNALGESEEAYRLMAESTENKINILKNNIETKLAPLGDYINEKVGNIAEQLSSSMATSLEKFDEAAEKIKKLKEEIPDLVARYRELKDETDPSKEAQEELKNVIQAIASAIPQAITQFDDYGKAMEISGEKALEWVERQQAALKYLNRQAIKQAERKLSRWEKDHKRVREEFEYITGEPGTRGAAPSTRASFAYADEEVLKKVQKEMEEYQLKIDGAREALKQLKGEFDDYDTPLDKFTDEVDQAKEGFEEIAKLRKKGLDDQVELNYSALLKQGKDWEAYLNTNLAKYKDNLAYQKVLLTELAEIEPEADLKVFNYEKFKTDLEAAKQGYDEIEKLRKTGLDDEVKTDYAGLLKQGDNYSEYLIKNLGKYKDHLEARKTLMLEYAEISPEIDLSSMIDKMITEGQEEIDKLLEDHLEANVDLEIEIDPVEIKKVEKFVNLFNKAVGEEKVKKLAGMFDDMGGTFNSLSGLLKEINTELGNAVSNLGDVVSGLSQVIKGTAEGNILKSAQGVFEMATGVYKIYKLIRDEADQTRKTTDEITNAMDRQRQILETQLWLLGQLEGSDWLSGAKESVEEISNKLAGAWATLESAEVTLGGNIVNTSRWNLDDWEKLSKAAKVLVRKGRASWEIDVDQYIENIKYWTEQLAGLNQEEESILGIDKQDLANVFVTAFQEGKLAAKDFADYSEQVIREAMLRAMAIQLISGESMEAFQNALKNAFDPEGDMGMLISEAEKANIATAEELVRRQAKALGEGMETAFPDLFGPVSSADPNSLAGAVRREMTEETAGVLAGTFNAIRVDTREILYAQQAAVDHLSDISDNTRFNRHLADIKNGIDSLNDKLGS